MDSASLPPVTALVYPVTVSRRVAVADNPHVFKDAVAETGSQDFPVVLADLRDFINEYQVLLREHPLIRFALAAENVRGAVLVAEAGGLRGGATEELNRFSRVKHLLAKGSQRRGS